MRYLSASSRTSGAVAWSPRLAARNRCDVIYCPAALTALRGRVPAVMTVFDMTTRLFPHTLDPLSGIYARQMLRIGRTSDMAGIPMWIPHATVALGFGLILVFAICGLIHLVVQRLTTRPAGEAETKP